MKLIWLNYSYFAFISLQKKAFVGDLNIVVRAMVEHGIHPDEIERAIDTMDEKHHNYTSFGALKKSFIASEYRKEYDCKIKAA